MVTWQFVLVTLTSGMLVIPEVGGLGTTVIEGDIYVEVIAAIYSVLHDNGTCSGIESEGVQNIEAIAWTVSELNKGDGLIPGVKIGVRVSETCRSVEKSKKLAYRLADEMENGTSDIMGVIGSDYSSDTGAISRLLDSLPNHQRLLQISYAATAAFLRNRERFGNFFRVISPDDLQVKVMLEMIKQLRWTYMAIVYDDDSYGKGGKDALLAGSRSSDICFPVIIPVQMSNYNTSKLGEEIKSRILNAETPLGGVLVFGSYGLANSVLLATEFVLSKNSNFTRPVLLFSESAGYLEGHKTNISRGMFVVSPPRRAVDEFQKHWKQLFATVANLNAGVLRNKWLKEMYADTFGCQLDKEVCHGISEAEVMKRAPFSLYNQFAVQTSMLMAKLIKQIHSKKCALETGVCTEMDQISRHELIDMMGNMTLNLDLDVGTLRIKTFRDPIDLILTFNGSAEVSIPDGFSLYEVYNHQVCNVQTKEMCFKRVAQFRKSSGLSITTSDIKDYDADGAEHSWPDVRKPQCPDQHKCSLCMDTDDDDDESTLFVPGDLYIVGVVPIHNIGPTSLTCSGIKQGGIDIVESIRFAIKEANEYYYDKIPTAKIGLIVIDSCNDPQIIQEKMLTLQRLGVYNHSVYTPVGDKIVGYIGGRSSSISAAIAAITTRLGFPQISYASTAPVLGDKSIYPYFLRVPSPDGEQARVIMKIIKGLNANFMQLLYSKSTYGEGGRDLILQLAKSMNVCVAQSVGTTSKLDELVKSIRMFPDAKVVVMFVGSSEVIQLVKYFNENLIRNEFLVISSESWGTRVSVRGYTNMIGSITIASELEQNPKFIDHMKDLKPSDSNVNPWIRPYMEHYFNCYYEWSYDKQSGKRCTGKETFDALQTNYRIDAWSPYTEKAVLALLIGAREAMEKYCGSSSTICDDLHKNANGFVDILKTIKLQDENDFRSRIFDDNGDGQAGYKLYTVALNADGDYVKIGASELIGFTFHKETYGSIRGEVLSSTCGTQPACQQCFPTPSVSAILPEYAVKTVLITLAGLLGVVCCVLILVITYLTRCRKCAMVRDRLNMQSSCLETEFAPEDSYDTIQLSKKHVESLPKEKSVDAADDGTQRERKLAGLPRSYIKLTNDSSSSSLRQRQGDLASGESLCSNSSYSSRKVSDERNQPAMELSYINMGGDTHVNRPTDSYLIPKPLNSNVYIQADPADVDPFFSPPTPVPHRLAERKESPQAVANETKDQERDTVISNDDVETKGSSAKHLEDTYLNFKPKGTLE